MDVEDMLRVSTDNIHRVLFHVQQKFLRVAPSKKPEILRDIIEQDLAKQKKVIIFSNKAPTSDFVQIYLKENKIPCVNFNAAHHYSYRRNILDKFLTGEVRTHYYYYNTTNIDQIPLFQNFQKMQIPLF